MTLDLPNTRCKGVAFDYAIARLGYRGSGSLNNAATALNLGQLFQEIVQTEGVSRFAHDGARHDRSK